MCIDFESWKLLYSSQTCLLSETTKQPLSNFELRKPWKYKNCLKIFKNPPQSNTSRFDFIQILLVNRWIFKISRQLCAFVSDQPFVLFGFVIWQLPMKMGVFRTFSIILSGPFCNNSERLRLLPLKPIKAAARKCSQESTCAGVLRPPTLLKKRFCHSCFLLNFAKLLK